MAMNVRQNMCVRNIKLYLEKPPLGGHIVQDEVYDRFRPHHVFEVLIRYSSAAKHLIKAERDVRQWEWALIENGPWASEMGGCDAGSFMAYVKLALHQAAPLLGCHGEKRDVVVDVPLQKKMELHK
jgi:hypothetical protein